LSCIAPGLIRHVLHVASHNFEGRAAYVTEISRGVGTGEPGGQMTLRNLPGSQARYFDLQIFSRKKYFLVYRSVDSQQNHLSCSSSCQILRLKCTKFDFGWGSARPLAGFKGIHIVK